MNKNSIKTMLFGIGIILLGNTFTTTKADYYQILGIALGLSGISVVMSGFFKKD